jgi:hypothetical protein
VVTYTEKYRLYQARMPSWTSYHDTIEEAKAEYEAILLTYTDPPIDGTRWYIDTSKVFEIIPVIVCNEE